MRFIHFLIPGTLGRSNRNFGANLTVHVRLDISPVEGQLRMSPHDTAQYMQDFREFQQELQNLGQRLSEGMEQQLCNTIQAIDHGRRTDDPRSAMDHVRGIGTEQIEEEPVREVPITFDEILMRYTEQEDDAPPVSAEYRTVLQRLILSINSDHTNPRPPRADRVSSLVDVLRGLQHRTLNPSQVFTQIREAEERRVNDRPMEVGHLPHSERIVEATDHSVTTTTRMPFSEAINRYGQQAEHLRQAIHQAAQGDGTGQSTEPTEEEVDREAVNVGL